jgi:hypothetical protein
LKEEIKENPTSVNEPRRFIPAALKRQMLLGQA